MTWEQIWAAIGSQFPDVEFRKWAEENYNPLKISPSNLSLFSQALAQDYPAQSGGATATAAPTKDGEITTDPVTGWQTYTKDGTTYVLKPLVKDKKGKWTYAGSKWEKFSTKEVPWQVSQWKQKDGSISAVQTPDSIGYYDQYGVPRLISEGFFPEQKEEPTISEDGNLYWDKKTGWQLTLQGEMAIVERREAAKATAAEQQATLARQDRQAEQQTAYESAKTVNWEKVLAQQRAMSQYLGETRNEGGVEFGGLQSPQTRPITAGGGPGNWITYWQQQQANINPATGTSWQTPAAYAGRVNEWLPPEQLAKLQGATNVDPNRQQVWDVTNNNWRPESEQEYNFRARIAPIRDVARGYQQGANFGIGAGGNPAEPNWMQNRQQQIAEQTLGVSPGAKAAQEQFWGQTQGGLNPMQQQAVSQMAQEDNALRVAEWQRTNPQFKGPVTPEWAKGVLMPVSQGRVNLGTLGTQGNMVRPVSAQMYQQWTPSQREGYGGLVGAQGKTYGPDYFENVQNMWQASRPGQLAQRRTRSY